MAHPTEPRREAIGSDEVVIGLTRSNHCPFRILHHHFFTPVPDLHDIRDEVPEALVAWIGRALSKKSEERFASTKDMVRALDVKARPDRISATALANRVWSIRTRTVTHDYRQRAIPDWDRYSVVDTILRAETS